MQRFKTIGLFFQLDKNNEEAINYTLDCARRNEANICVLCAQKQALPTAEKEKIQQLLSSELNTEFEMHFLEGHPVVVLCQAIEKSQIDLLITEPDTPRGFKRFFFGSMTLSLLRKAPCPVWVAKPKAQKAYRNILICVDPAADDEAAQLLTNKLIEIGTSLAQREAAQCHLLAAWSLPGESTLNSPFVKTPTAEIEALKNNEKVKAAKSFELIQATNKSHLEHCQTHLIYGEPSQAVTDFAQEQQVDLVVMGTLARSGMEGFVIGNTAEAIINQLECSILAIKPDGFVSPLV